MPRKGGQVLRQGSGRGRGPGWYEMDRREGDRKVLRVGEHQQVEDLGVLLLCPCVGI